MNTISLYFAGIKEQGSIPRLIAGPFMHFNEARTACEVIDQPGNFVVIEAEIPVTTTIISHVTYRR